VPSPYPARCGPGKWYPNLGEEWYEETSIASIEEWFLVLTPGQVYGVSVSPDIARRSGGAVAC